MAIEKNHVVTMGYTLKTSDGEIIDSSEGGDPLMYIHGSGQILPALEKAITGRNKGDKFHISLSAADGYGEYNEELVQAVSKKEFQSIPDLKVGMQFEVDTDEGTQLMTVAGVTEEVVMMDSNHPLAGVELNFDIEIIDFRAATAQELSHGHVHGHHGHDH